MMTKTILPLIALFFMHFTAPALAQTPTAVWPSKTHYRYADILGQQIFYREAGDKNSPTIVLLHGYPSSSHTYRELIPLLSGRYHVIAPDYLGSGFSSQPDPKAFTYDFDTLANYVEALLKKLNVDKYVLYMQDFGAPVGYRLMAKQPENIQAIVVQNANAYLEGLTPARQDFFNHAQLDNSAENVEKLFQITSEKAVVNSQYLRDVSDHVEVMSPDAWTHDLNFLSSESQRNIQVALFQDYKSNLDAYPAWQQLLKKHQFPTLITWGANDPAFIAEGAKAYLKHVPNAELHLLDAGHFAVEEKAVEIAQLITAFLGEDGHSGSITQQLSLPKSLNKDK